MNLGIVLLQGPRRWVFLRYPCSTERARERKRLDSTHSCLMGILSTRSLELLTAWGEACGVGCNIEIAVAVRRTVVRAVGWLGQERANSGVQEYLAHKKQPPFLGPS